MYIAHTIINGKKQYVIRESVLKDGVYRFRELMNLGPDPGIFVKYPHNNAFYIDGSVEDHLTGKGMEVSQDDLEDIFWPYVRPDVKYRFRYFRSKGRSRKAEQTALHEFHSFDIRRLHFLKFGQMDQSRLYTTSSKMFQVLKRKSRDELEQYFMLNEKILKPKELKSYVYVIFNLQKHFGKIFI